MDSFLKVLQNKRFLFYLFFLMILSYSGALKNNLDALSANHKVTGFSYSDQTFFSDPLTLDDQINLTSAEEVFDLKDNLFTIHFYPQNGLTQLSSSYSKEPFCYPEKVRLQDKYDLYDLYCDWQFDA